MAGSNGIFLSNIVCSSRLTITFLNDQPFQSVPFSHPNNFFRFLGPEVKGGVGAAGVYPDVSCVMQKERGEGGNRWRLFFFSCRPQYQAPEIPFHPTLLSQALIGEKRGGKKKKGHLINYALSPSPERGRKRFCFPLLCSCLAKWMINTPH